MRWHHLFLLVLFALPVNAQTWQTVVAGARGGCEPVTPITFPAVQWLGSDAPPDTSEDIHAVAPAPGGRVYALVQAGSGWRVAEIRPDGSRTLRTGVVSGVPIALVVDAAGAMFVLYHGSVSISNSLLLVFNPDGSQRASYNLGARYTFRPQFLFISGWTAMDLAADQCTLFLTGSGGVIRRFNACTGTFGPDFTTTQQPWASALRVLPGGGLIVSTQTLAPSNPQLERYAADGTFVTAFSTAPPIGALMLIDDGTRLLIGESDCFPTARLTTINPATGATESMVNLQMDQVGTIVSRNGWTAALGATHVDAIPAAGTTALIGLVILLIGVSLIRLR